MKTYLPAAAFGVALTAAALAFGAATAHAADYTSESASQATADLTAMGYSVQFNGNQDGDLSTCQVTGVEGLTEVPEGTVYIDIACLDT
jgi:hypothetical protein